MYYLHYHSEMHRQLCNSSEHIQYAAEDHNSNAIFIRWLHKSAEWRHANPFRSKSQVGCLFCTLCAHGITSPNQSTAVIRRFWLKQQKLVNVIDPGTVRIYLESSRDMWVHIDSFKKPIVHSNTILLSNYNELKNVFVGSWFQPTWCTFGSFLFPRHPSWTSCIVICSYHHF